MEKILFFHHFLFIRLFPKYLGVILVFLFSFQISFAQTTSEVSQKEEAVLYNAENIYLVGDAEIIVKQSNGEEILLSQVKSSKIEPKKVLAKSTKADELVKKELQKKVESPQKKEIEVVAYFKNNGSSSTNFTFYVLQKKSCVLSQNTLDYSVKYVQDCPSSTFAPFIVSRERESEFSEFLVNKAQSNWRPSVYSRPPPLA